MLVSGRVSKNKTSHLVKIKINKNNSFEEKLFIYLGLKDFENIFFYVFETKSRSWLANIVPNSGSELIKFGSAYTGWRYLFF